MNKYRYYEKQSENDYLRSKRFGRNSFFIDGNFKKLKKIVDTRKEYKATKYKQKNINYIKII